MRIVLLLRASKMLIIRVSLEFRVLIIHFIYEIIWEPNCRRLNNYKIWTYFRIHQLLVHFNDQFQKVGIYSSVVCATEKPDCDDELPVESHSTDTDPKSILKMSLTKHEITTRE